MATADRKVESPYKVIGTRPIRHDGVDKVTGRAIYGNDVQLPGLVHGKVLRSPHAHARIRSIDTRSAEALPGVLAVATFADLDPHEDKMAELGEGAVNLRYLTENVLARGRALYKGHAVAAVAAISPHVAEQALALIHIDYDPLPAVTWILDAMKPEAPILLEELRTSSMGKVTGKGPTNIASHLLFAKGNIDEGFAQADLIIEREFRTQTVHQGYIEPHVATAQWSADGHVMVWASTQGSFTCRQQVAEILAIPLSKVTVKPCEIGGGFGGKIRVYLEPIAALLSKKSGRPVKVSMSRADVFEGTGPTPGSFIRVKLGSTNDGKLVAGEAWMAYDAGAYPAGMIGPGAVCVFACYDIPHQKIEGFDVVLNKPQSSAYRAPGSTNAAFASESVINELADRLGIDPLEFRLKNVAREGTRRADGPAYARIGLAETIEAAQAHTHYLAPPPGKHRGRGVACGYWMNAGLKSSCTAHVNADGTVTLLEGSTDIGGTRTSVAMQLAETLGLAAEDIIPRVVDTDSVGYTDVTGGSRVTFATGWAAHEVGLDLIMQLRKRAAKIWELDAEKISFEQGSFHAGDKSMSFKELAAKLHHFGGPVTSQASVEAKGPGGAFATHIADVEVDPETGKVKVLRYTAIQDCGRAIHPSYVEGQIHGGVAQGIGWALNEEYFYDDKGRMRNASMLDYRMPTAVDLPMIEAVIVEVPNPRHPYGVRGVGEVPICPPPAALAAAIHNAVGVRMTELPMSPPKVHQAMTRRPPDGNGATPLRGG
ncbi:xanthine dehydrogenase family protein molybdopterin-binding subunit [bacterium]|jgi:xanthine dehydrogenase molybdenum-binding subunit|nr:xanthine dehydrogenase family protein molybdopterin-binding subunit [bacterium]